MRLACPGLFSAIDQKATIVVSSPLLAAIAAQQATTSRLNEARDSYERPFIFTTDAWLSVCWQQARYAGEAPLLLSPSQERALWKQIVEHEHPHLFDANAAARLARRAAGLLAEWSISPEGDLWFGHEDAEQFQVWLRLFRRKCREEGWITRSDLWNLVPQWIRQGLCPANLTVFAAFRNTTPALDAVMQALGHASSLQVASVTRARVAHPAKSFGSFDDELEYAARFARSAFERDASQSISVFVPDLLANRATVHRVFEDIFYPSRPSSRADRETHRVFHINAASSLTGHPITANALLLLELARPRIGHAEAEAILRSPFTAGAADERSGRALADLALRKKRELDVTLADIEAASAHCPLFVRLCAAVRRVLRRMPKQAELPVWCDFIRDLLQATGWPGNVALTAEEQQAVEQWNETLSSLAELGLILNRATYDTTLANLRRLLAAPKLETGDWFSPVQILDAKDAYALESDYAILTGMSEEMWPPPVELSPLVPLSVQRAHRIPGSSQQSAREMRERMTEDLFYSAPILTATYSARLSPMSEPFIDRCEAELSAWRGKLPLLSYPPVSLDEQEDTRAPRYVARELSRGGTSLIKAQSLCPFRAFAEFRLQARAPEDACFGFDARDRGGFVHRALQFVWQRLRTQHQLRSISQDQLRSIIQQAVSEAVNDDESSPFHRLVSSAERERLETLILDWLLIERARKQPFTVETIEQERCYEIPGLLLKLRVDRIDRLENGRVLLIDYKTGKQTKKKLECPRPAEPQLLIYAAATGDPVDGVFFGELKAREPRPVGYSREKHFDTGSSVTVLGRGWDAFLQGGQQEVARIASEFVEGYAAVDPVHHACEYCAIKPLCRISESASTTEEQE